MPLHHLFERVFYNPLMGANPRRSERWAVERNTRHVWILREYRWLAPWQGYVLAWRRHSYRWSALVVYVPYDDPEWPAVQKWFAQELLVPVWSVPDDLLRNPFPRYRRQQERDARAPD